MRLALLLSVSANELEDHPRLLAVIADSVAHATQLLDAFPRQTTVSDGLYAAKRGPLEFWGRDHEKRARAADPFEQTLAVGGFLIPAVLAKLHDPTPAERAIGCLLLERLGAFAQVDHVDSLATDPAAYVEDHWDVTSRGTVGETARAVARGMRDGRTECYSFEDGIWALFRTGLPHVNDDDLIGGIRETSSSLEAANWDEWWDDARPLWRDWWRMAGDGRGPSDREAWLNRCHEYEGFRLIRHDNALGRTELTITGPPGTKVRVESNGAELGTGLAPLIIVTPPDSTIARLARAEDRRGHYVWRVYGVEAWLPNGRYWKFDRFAWERSASLRVEVLEQPRHADVRERPGSGWKHGSCRAN